MKQILKKFLSTAGIVVSVMLMSLGFVGAISSPSYAACDVNNGIGGAVNEDCSKGSGQQTELFGEGGIITLIINIMLFIIGILCVIMIIFGGIRYTISNGDKSKVENAKNTIVYAVVGLVIAIVAFALVNWVFKSIGSTS